MRRREVLAFLAAVAAAPPLATRGATRPGPANRAFERACPHRSGSEVPPRGLAIWAAGIGLDRWRQHPHSRTLGCR